MSTSDWSPLESEDVAMLRRAAGTSFNGPVTLPSGRILPADEATALAAVYAPAAAGLPTVDGDGVNRSTCVHGEIRCPRCTIAEVRHQAAIEPNWEREGSGVTGRGLGVLLLLLLILGIGVACGLYVLDRLPRP